MNKLSDKNDHVFHVTSTDAIITLNDAKIVNEDAEKTLPSVCTDGWSGGKDIATSRASRQTLAGAVKIGSDSTLSPELSDGLSLEGSVDDKINDTKDESASTEVGTISVTLDSTSTWTLSANSYVSSFNGNAANATTDGHTFHVNGITLTGAEQRSGKETETDAIVSTKVYEKKDGLPQFGRTALLAKLFFRYENLRALNSPAKAVRSRAYKAEFLPKGKQIGLVAIDRVDANTRGTTVSN